MFTIRFYRIAAGANKSIHNNHRKGIFTRSFNSIDDVVKFVVNNRFLGTYNIHEDLNEHDLNVFLNKYKAIMVNNSKLLKNTAGHRQAVKHLKRLVRKYPDYNCYKWQLEIMTRK